MAREEVALPLPLHPPSVNHPPLISMMMIMMEMTKGPRVQALLPPLILSIHCQMTFLKSFLTHPTSTQTWNHSTLAKPKSSTVKFNCEMSNMVE
ncbi:hypothetical protein Tco_0725780 [Tanacetum coccineum]|uniref:Uncharacterized protein n=1 Tax=Tanacetum coccineum TaxID=301880 RepID=A0ABQ4YDV1_9ASTR